MNNDFEVWARAEINSLRAKADEIERALALFLSWRAAGGRTGTPITRNSITNGHPTYSVNVDAPAKQRKRASKSEPIFAAFEAAGPSGLDQNELAHVAESAGITSSRASIRSLCWTAKQDGRLISLAPGRYAIAPRNGAAVENLTGETAAPTRQDNDQHREGDAGGGI